MKHSQVTPEILDTLREGIAAGKTAEVLSREIGRGRSTTLRYIREFLPELHRGSGSHSPATVRLDAARVQVSTLYSAGTTMKELAGQYGVSPATLKQALKTWGVELRKNWDRTGGTAIELLTPATLDEICSGYATMSMEALAAKHGVCVASIRKVLKAHDVATRSRGPVRDDQAARSTRLKRTYGVSAEWYDSALAAQGGRCAVCRCASDHPRNHGNAVLSVDHDHITGAVRGLLCQTCNLVLGHLEDNATVIEGMRQYLVKHPVKERRAYTMPQPSAELQAAVNAVVEQSTRLSPTALLVDVNDIAGAHKDMCLCIQQTAGVEQVFLSCDSGVYLDMVKHLAGSSERRHARKMTVRAVDASIADPFYELNHLQGRVGRGKHFALYDGDTIVACMTFGPPTDVRSPRKATMLKRYATVGAVSGGAGRLLAAYKKYDPTARILTYSDRRYSGGKLYKTLGFMRVETTAPDYAYLVNGTLVNKAALQKPELVRRGGGTMELTERELANNLQYQRVYDCGKDVWILA